MIVPERSPDMEGSSWTKPVGWDRFCAHPVLILIGERWLSSVSFCLCPDVDDEYEDEEDQWEEGAEDILEKGEEAMKSEVLTTQTCEYSF